MSKKTIYYADFETTKINEDGDVEVYLWCMISENGKRYHGFNIESFIEQTFNMKGVCFFHNLRFDVSYIHSYLLQKNIDYGILEKKNTIYSFRYGLFELRDTLNFLPITLAEMGEQYCTNFKKTSIDYNHNIGDEVTPEEIDYCFNDCEVLREGFTNFKSALIELLTESGCHKSIHELNKKLTIAGVAFSVFRELSLFDKICPKTTPLEFQNFRGAYKGGYVYSNSSYGLAENVKMIDCNSMYPSIYAEMPLPFGRAYRVKTFSELEKAEFFIAKILIKYELKEGYVPIIGGGVGKFGAINYKASSDGEYEELTVCNIDLELIKKYYDCDINYIWAFKWHTKPQFFKNFADIFINFKNRFKGVKRNVAKLILNSPYGKTAMNGFNDVKKYFLENGVVKSEVIGYQLDADAFQYLPIAIAITAGARKKLLEAGEAVGFENVLYMDTDSVKFIGDFPKNLEINPDKLGAWKDEGTAELFKTIAPKKYIYYEKNQLHVTCAGFNKKIIQKAFKCDEILQKNHALELMREFKPGFALECLQSKLTKGGRALVDVVKVIK